MERDLRGRVLYPSERSELTCGIDLHFPGLFHTNLRTAKIAPHLLWYYSEAVSTRNDPVAPKTDLVWINPDRPSTRPDPVANKPDLVAIEPDLVATNAESVAIAPDRVAMNADPVRRMDVFLAVFCYRFPIFHDSVSMRADLFAMKADPVAMGAVSRFDES